MIPRSVQSVYEYLDLSCLCLFVWLLHAAHCGMHVFFFPCVCVFGTLPFGSRGGLFCPRIALACGCAYGRPHHGFWLKGHLDPMVHS